MRKGQRNFDLSACVLTARQCRAGAKVKSSFYFAGRGCGTVNVGEVVAWAKLKVAQACAQR
jgi:hypothetical protein